MSKRVSEPTQFERFKQKVLDFQEGYTDEITGFAIQAKQITVGKRKYLYAAIQEAFIIGSELLLPENEAVLDELLKSFGLSRDNRKGTNPWMPVVNMLFGHWHTGKDDQTKFIVDRSAKKYAATMRYMQEDKWEPETVATELETFVTGKASRRRRGLAATEDLDRDKHRNEQPDEQEQLDDMNRLLRAAIPLGSIERDDLSNRAMEEGEFIQLWGRRSGRMIVVYGEMYSPSGNNNRVVAYVYQAAREAFGWVDKRLGGMENGKGCVPPRRISPLWSHNVLEQERKQPSERHMKKLAERAIKGGKHHPQRGDKKLAGKPVTAPKKPTKRKGVRVSGKVQVGKTKLAA